MNRPAQIAILILMATACAHGPYRGVVAMKINDTDSHVSLGTSEVKAGDRVSILHNKCRRAPGGIVAGLGYGPACTLEKTGEGQIIESLGGDYSLMRVEPNVRVEEKYLVEKR